MFYSQYQLTSIMKLNNVIFLSKLIYIYIYIYCLTPLSMSVGTENKLLKLSWTNPGSKPHGMTAVWLLTSHLTNQQCPTYLVHLACKINKICGTLLEKQWQTYKWHSWMYPYTWMCQGWLTNKNLHQLVCADTGCSLEDLLEVIDDRVGWRERKRVRKFNAVSVTWWWWWWWWCTHIYIYIYVYMQRY